MCINWAGRLTNTYVDCCLFGLVPRRLEGFGRVRAAGVVRVRAVLLRLRLLPTMDVAYEDNNVVFVLSCILTSETPIFVYL